MKKAENYQKNLGIITSDILTFLLDDSKDGTSTTSAMTDNNENQGGARIPRDQESPVVSN